ncbi:MAG: FG-GAP-like repeat-containing protein [Planctomycetota bacterium]
MLFRPLILAVLLLLVTAMEVAGLAQDDVSFRVRELNLDSEFSAATAFDMNGDGSTDIISGAWWYSAQDWKPRRFREVEQIRGRCDDYSNLAHDLDRDGDMDIISVNYRSKSLYWSKNPGAEANQQGELWERIVIDVPGTSETGRLVDMDGDGDLDILPNGTKFAAWYELKNSEVAEFVKRNLPQQLAGHGLGAGDINGDGRVDVVCPKGWAEAPEDPRTERWIFHHEFDLAPDCSIPILVWDVDGDGDQDLVWGRGHDIGLYWTEQLQELETDWNVRENDIPEYLPPQLLRTKWITHAIDTRFSSQHTIIRTDIDGDGSPDLLTGKRYQGHDGKDPGENDPGFLSWYEFDTDSKSWGHHPITAGGKCSIDLDSVCCDLDGDGDQDVVAPSRAGLYWLENLGATKKPADPTSTTNHLSYGDHTDLTQFFDESSDSLETIKNRLDHGIRRSHILEGMQAAMGKLPQSKQRVPLLPVIHKVEDADTYLRVLASIRTEPTTRQEHRLPFYLLIPKNLSSPAPAMLCLHPTQFELGKAQICGLGGKPSRFYAHELAQRGYICMAPDYPSFADYADYDFESDSFESGTMKAIWDNIRCIDLLEQLPCVASDKIGAIGHSLGGHNALFTATMDQRVRCVVTSCGFTAFEDYYQGNLKGWTSSRYMPRILSEYSNSPEQMPFDFPEVLAAIAPRPIFVNAPIHDSNFAVAGVRKCESALQPLFELLGNRSETTFVYPHAEHDFPEDIRLQAYEWLDKQLKQ